MRSLIAEIALVLTRMRYVSEGSAGSPPDADRVTQGFDSRPPTGAQSLYDAYAGPNGEFRLLLWRAQRDLANRQKRSSRRGGETKEERNERIVAMYQGVPAAKVSVYEDLSVTQIRAVREELGYSAHEGYRIEAGTSQAA